MSIDVIPRNGLGYTVTVGENNDPSSDGSGARIGGGDDDHGEGEGHCERQDWCGRFGVSRVEDITRDQLRESGELHPVLAVQHACGVAGCELIVICSPRHGLFESGSCKQG